jgi:hypothetical protein
MRGRGPPRQVRPSVILTQPTGGTVHGLKQIFLGLSLALIALGLAYLGLAARAVEPHEQRGAVLVGLGAGAALVGVALWGLVRRMSNAG